MFFQRAVLDWSCHVFEAEMVNSRRERCYRVLEEVGELVQSAGIKKGEAINIIDYVFEREVESEIEKEFGGALVTLFLMAEVFDVNLEDAACRELSRCWEMSEVIKEKQANKPRAVTSKGSTTSGLFCADYYYFKETGKWKYHGKGKSIPKDDPEYFSLDHDKILKLNNCMPGISGKGKEYTIVIVDHESYPRMIPAVC